MTPAEVADVEAALGTPFTRPALLAQALEHRSHAFEAGGLPTNERLEFLGDAVLGLLVTERIYALLPDEPEGRLAKVRAAAVNTRTLADVARALGLGEHVRLGRGEEQSGGRDKDSILADTFEAVLGALYLDRGLVACRDLVERLFAPLLADIATRRASLDFKTSLQELTASAFATLPVYVVSEAGPDHAKRFTAEVTVDDEVVGRGEGRSKKEAEQAAAGEAHARLAARLALDSAPPPLAADGQPVVESD